MVEHERSRPPRAPGSSSRGALVVERVQTGVRIEKRIFKVLKSLADYHDFTLGDLLEGIVLHAFEGKSALRTRIAPPHRRAQNDLPPDLDAGASHRLVEE